MSLAEFRDWVTAHNAANGDGSITDREADQLDAWLDKVEAAGHA